MILLIASVLLQVACIVHAIKTGRNQIWIMVIAFLSVIGCIAYFVAEILPGLGTNRYVRDARANVTALVDPERDLRAANEQLAVVDTAANRIAVADALSGLGRHFEALPHYREAIGKAPEAQVRMRLARALFETGDAAGTIEQLDLLPETRSIGEQDRRQLLRARALEALARGGEAETIYADIVTRLPGEEARCRYAALLLAIGKQQKARDVLQEVEVRMKRLSRAQRAPDAEMYEWAIRELSTLRANGSS